MDLIEFINFCWLQYLEKTPSAKKIFDGLLKLGETVKNDHIALRTFHHPGITKEDFARYFTDQGMKICGEYDFPKKKLSAIHLEFEDEPDKPKVFISEIYPDQLSEEAQKIISDALSVLKETKDLPTLIKEKRPWRLTYENYQTLKKESEYAAWLCAYGFFPNHFTISVNELKHFPELKDLTDWVSKQGITLNSSGGVVKGSEKELLEQASTMADVGMVLFDEGEFEVPTCYYEFAKRYPDENGLVYQGFIAGNSDKIFESTNTEKKSLKEK
jgi:hypothetical protein